MNTDDTLVPDTQTVAPESTGAEAVYAWADEPEDEESSGEGRRWRPGNNTLVASAVTGALAAATFVAAFAVRTLAPSEYHDIAQTPSPPVTITETIKPPAAAHPSPWRLPPPTQQVSSAPEAPPVVAPPSPTVTVTAQPQSLPEFLPPPNAYQRWLSLLNSRGLRIQPGHESDNDQHVRNLCTALATDDNPTWRANTVQTAIQETEQSSPNWGLPEASYAVRAALQVYCPQFNR